MTEVQKLRRSPLRDAHVEAGARLVEFAGWEMPVQYSGVIEEHRAVRSAAGLFDVSHMGEIAVSGPGAEAFLDRVTPNQVSRLRPGRAHYSGLLTERGTYVDDLLVYKLEDARFLLVVNAANTARDLDWLQQRADREVRIEDRSDRYALLALQGPKSPEILQRLTGQPLEKIRYYRFAMAEVAGVPALVSRTGYTGEDGFELYVEPERANALWRELMTAGAGDGLLPAGLGARDTLRLEAAMALYGHELDEETTPLEAGLDWVVKFAKEEFIGREALIAQRESGVERRLAGFELTGRGIARPGYSVAAAGEEVGRVTSGTWSPTFEKAIGLVYLPTALAEAGTDLEIDIRGRGVGARVVEIPFYRRG